MISTTFLHNISKSFRKFESTFGNRDFCFLAMDNWDKAIQDFEGDVSDLASEIKQMVYLVKNTSPRFAFLIFMVLAVEEEFEDFMEEAKQSNLSDLKTFLSQTIKRVQSERKESTLKLLKHSEGLISEGQTILLHDASHTVFDILLLTKERGVKFEVLVAEQDVRKTTLIINFLQSNNITFKVVPEYLISYLENEIDIVLLGATTINSLYEVVADAGTRSLVSEIKSAGKKVVVSITTDKFSLWRAEEFHSHKKQTHVTQGGVEYDKLMFSHDRFPVNWVDAFVTNKGVLSSLQLCDFYNESYAKQEIWRGRHTI